MKLSNGKIAIPIENDIIMIIENDNIAKYIDGIEQQNEKLIEIAKRNIDRTLCNSVYECEECFLKADCVLFEDIKEFEQITGKKFEI